MRLNRWLFAVCTLVWSWSAQGILLDSPQPSVFWQDLPTDLVLPLAEDMRQSELQSIVHTLRVGDPAVGKQQLSQFLRAHPEDPQALVIAGSLLMAEGKYPQAQVAFESAIKSGAGSQALPRLGVTRLLMGDLARGEQILQEALRHHPDDPLALRYMAWLADRSGQYEAQGYYLQRLVSQQPPGAVTEAVLALARLYEQQRAYTALFELVSPRWPRAETHTGASYDVLAYYYALAAVITRQEGAARASQQRVEQAAEPLLPLLLAIARNYAVGNTPSVKRLVAQGERAEQINNIELWYHSARLAYAAGDDDVAAEWLEKALESIMDTPAWYTGRVMIRELGGIYLSQHRTLDALAMYRRYASQFADDPGYIYEHAEFLVASNQFSAAQARLNALEALTPDHRVAYLRGVIARRQQQADEAVGWFSRAANEAPGDVAVWVQWAGVVLEQGQTDEALKVLARGLIANPRSPELAFEYASLQELRGSHEAAIQAYEALLAMVPDHIGALDNLAQLLLEADKPQVARALELSQRAQQLAPQDPYLKIGVAKAHRAMGQTAEARQLLEDVLATAQTSPDVTTTARNLLESL